MIHEKGVGACGFYSKVKTEEELAEEERIKEVRERVNVIGPYGFGLQVVQSV